MSGCEWEVFFAYMTKPELPEGLEAGAYALCNGPTYGGATVRGNSCGYISLITHSQDWHILSDDVLRHMIAHYEYAARREVEDEGDDEPA